MRILLRTALCAVATTTALVTEVTIVPRFELPGGGAPNLVLLVVLALAAAWGTSDGAVAGFGVGLIQDIAPPDATAIGRHALTYTLVGALAGYAAREVRRSALRTSLLSAVYAVAATVVNLCLGAVLGDGTPWSRPGLLTSLGATGLYTAVATPLVIPGLYALARRLHAGDARTLAPVGDATRQTRGLTPIPMPSFSSAFSSIASVTSTSGAPSSASTSGSSSTLGSSSTSGIRTPLSTLTRMPQRPPSPAPVSISTSTLTPDTESA